MKKTLWQQSYENNFIGVDDNTPEIKSLNDQSDSKLKTLLPSDVFDEIYDLTAKLQWLIGENAYRAGFMAGLDR